MTNPPDKRFKALISSAMTGHKQKSQKLATELVESILETKEEFIMECLFGKLNTKGPEDAKTNHTP